MQRIAKKSTSPEMTMEFAKTLGTRLKGGEIFELVSDLGGGKTTFVRGLAHGFGSKDPVASPSFTISYVYRRFDGKQLHHFDFYRLDDAGVVGAELAEVQGSDDVVIAIEWGKLVHDILPAKRITITLEQTEETTRTITCTYPKQYQYIFEGL